MRLFLLLMLLLISGPAFSQNEVEGEELTKKNQELETPSEDYSRKSILIPIIYYTPETKVAAGGLYIKNLWKEREGRTSSVSVMTSLTLNQQILASFAPKFYFSGGHWEAGGLLFYRHYPNKFYGRGFENSFSSPEKYTDNNILIGLNGGRNLYSHLYLRGGLTQDLQKNVDFEAGGRVEAENLAYTRSFQVTALNFSLEWDERDYPQAPRQGALYKATQHFYEPTDREGSKDLERFRKVDFDLRQYVLLAPKWVGALQVFASEVQGAQIPFQYLNSMGGGSKMRGYYSGQYLDKALGMVQAELRFEKTPKWTPAIFTGVARMGEGFADLNSTQSVYSAGFGVHYTLDPENRTKLRLDLGFTGKETGFYFLLGEAF